MIRKLLSPEVQKYIREHQRDDPFLLSLNKKKEDGFPLDEAIRQIQSLQKAKSKTPSWTEKENIVWPPPVSIEQSSSEVTARFKASLIRGKSLIDLTGGMGVDTSFFSDRFEEVLYVEPVENLCELAHHNFKILGKTNIKIYRSTAENFLHQNLTSSVEKKLFDGVFIDPSRRSEDKKVFRISDCFPDLYEIIPSCMNRAAQILVKLSPLVDLSLLIRDFDPADIWVVSVKGEVKEVLFLIDKGRRSAGIHAIELNKNGGSSSEFTFFYKEEIESKSDFSLPRKYLYEPNAAILKAGAFKLVGKRYNLKKLHKHTHLYTSDKLVVEFPGKALIIKEVVKPNKGDILRQFPNKQANVISRNYPLSPSQLKKKFALKDGGDQFLIGTTLTNGKRVLLWCERAF